MQRQESNVTERKAVSAEGGDVPCGGVRRFPPTQEGIAAAGDFLDEVFEKWETAQPSAFKPSNLPTFKLSNLSPAAHVVLDEIASNIVKHSGATFFDLAIESINPSTIKPSPPSTINPSNHQTIKPRAAGAPGVALVFTDDGAPYDPLAHADPDTSLPAEDRPIGGLGILMVKKMASSVTYRRDGARNVLTVRLSRPPSS